MPALITHKRKRYTKLERLQRHHATIVCMYTSVQIRATIEFLTSLQNRIYLVIIATDRWRVVREKCRQSELRHLLAKPMDADSTSLLFQPQAGKQSVYRVGEGREGEREGERERERKH